MDNMKRQNVSYSQCRKWTYWKKGFNWEIRDDDGEDIIRVHSKCERIKVILKKKKIKTIIKSRF